MLMAVLTLSALVLAGLFAWSILGSRAEHAAYRVVSTNKDIELRAYGATTVAETETTGERKEAISQGFRILADYIFGNNTARTTIAMTAPVTQQTGEKIAMTAPVTQTQSGGKWQVRFMMPSRYDRASLPAPNNRQIMLKDVPPKTYAVIRFTGVPDDLLLAEKLEKLRHFMDAQHMRAVSDPVYAFFNPPWTLPFLRRNEIMIETAP